MTHVNTGSTHSRWLRAIRRGAAIAALAALTACGGSMPTASSPPQDAGDLPAAIEQMIANSQAIDAPGLVIALVHNGQPTLVRTGGVSSLSSKQAIDAGTTFEIASLTKHFTALGVMQLISEGKAQLTDPIRTYLPELPPTWDGINIHQLLSHQSGVPDYLNRLPRAQLDGMDNKALLQFFAANPALDFTPGTRGAYSNGNYVLLAEVIEKISGQSFSSYMQQAVFAPLGMSQSGIAGPASSSALNLGIDAKPFGITQATTGPIGMVASIADLQSFMERGALGQAIAPSVWTQMTTPRADFSDGSVYGYGLYVSRSDSFASHGGRLDGFRSLLYIDRKRGFAVAMLGNGGGPTEALQLQLLALIRSSIPIGN